MLTAFLTRKVLAAIIGAFMTALATWLASQGIEVGAETIDLWREALIAVAGIGLSAYGGTEGRAPVEIEQ
ncbi:hypothetical protein [uncultured Celeribacter sp.]|uniref:hypothetical protein n=1 Tax=uncultured Celeribacter sp. TaxID=1303376 RepID=UPI002AA8FE6E|nr:hypothetical protein [uncultured Celeribacter sp.]